MSQNKPKAIVSWSSGKDSAMALYKVLRSNQFQVIAMLTTVSDPFQRVSMHGVREELLDRQAASIGIPIEKIRIPYPCPNEVYEQKMSETMVSYKSSGLTHAIFGDLFLEDIRKYREEKLSQFGIIPVFPLWREDTSRLARTILGLGFKAVITCVDPKKLDVKFAGRHFDADFLNEIPLTVDPCGENGEFHTFVYDGPIFKRSIEIVVGDCVMRDGFQFADVLLR